MIGGSNDQTNFPHELLLTNRQVANLCKTFVNNSSADIKFSKTQFSKMIKLGQFLGRLLGPLLKAGLPLMKNIIKPLAKSVLIPLGFTAAASAANTGIHKKIFGSRKRPLDLALPNNTTALIISDDDMEYIIEIVKSLEDSGLFLKGVSV